MPHGEYNTAAPGCDACNQPSTTTNITSSPTENLQTTTATQRGAAISNWALRERQRNQGEPTNAISTSLQSFSLKPKAEDLGDHSGWATPKRPLMDGGQGKKVAQVGSPNICTMGRRTRLALIRRRQRERGTMPTTDAMPCAASDVTYDVALPPVQRAGIVDGPRSSRAEKRWRRLRWVNDPMTASMQSGQAMSLLTLPCPRCSASGLLESPTGMLYCHTRRPMSILTPIVEQGERRPHRKQWRRRLRRVNNPVTMSMPSKASSVNF